MSRLRVNAAFICGLQVGVPFRLDLGEAYFNKSQSLEMLVPFRGNSTAIQEPRLARIQTGIVAVIANITGQR